MATKEYALHIPDDVERQLRKCRAPIRESIRKRLKEITVAASATLLAGRRLVSAKGPPLRFYVFEGYRVFYQVNPSNRRVLVLKIQTEAS